MATVSEPVATVETLAELLEQLGVAGIGGQEPLELGAGHTQVARAGISLGQADRRLALVLRRLRLLALEL